MKLAGQSFARAVRQYPICFLHRALYRPLHAATPILQETATSPNDPSTVSISTPGEPSVSPPAKKTKRKRSSRNTKIVEEEKEFSPIRSKPHTTEVVLQQELVQANPLLSDLEKLRPQVLVHPDHPKYAHFYRNTVELLDRSFTKAQLLRFLDQLSFSRPPTTRTKQDLIRYFLQYWKMPPPEEEKKVDSQEMAEKDFPLLPSELFLLMGTDGSDLLRLSHKYEARLTPIPNPLRLRAYGPTKALEKMAAEIEKRKSAMIAHQLKLQCAAGVRPDLIQTISRISGAFIENAGEGEVRITSLDQESGEIARRLAERAGIEARDAALRPVLAHVPDGDEPSNTNPARRTDYALYPFLVPGVLPWTMGYSNPFRMRRVGSWLSDGSRLAPVISLSSGRWVSKAGTKESLREVLLGGLPPQAVGLSRTICATAGYHLVSAPGSQSLSRVSLVPPIRDAFDLETFMGWLAAGNGSTTFLPGIPPGVRTETLKPRRITTVEDILVYRLRYEAAEEPADRVSSARSAPETKEMRMKDVLDVEINFTLWQAVLPSTTLPSTKQSTAFTSPLHAEPPSRSGQDHAAQGQAAPVDRYTPESSAIPPRVMTARRGTASSLDVLLPERQFDLRLSVMDMTRVAANEIPPELIAHLIDCRRAYTDNDKLPETPFSLVLEDVRYYLTTSEIVRTSQREENDVSRIFEGAAPHGQTAVTVLEKVADRDILEQQTLQCRVYSSEPLIDDVWENFLSSCEHITGDPRQADEPAFQLDPHETQSPINKQKMYG